jgi:hypothetical protein
VGVLARRRAPATVWGAPRLEPVALVPPPHADGFEATWPGPPEGADSAAAWLGLHPLRLHSGDTGHFRDNLGSGRPSVWVALAEACDPARAAVRMVTADPYEGEAVAGDDALLVEALPMPDWIAEAVARFVAAHHVEIPFEKRRRSPAAPEADPRAPRILRPEDKWGRR